MPRVRITKAEKELRDKKVAYAGEMKAFCNHLLAIEFDFPQVKESVRMAHAALVDLSEAIQGIGVEK